MSSDLVWSIVRKQNAFLVKRDFTEFSREKGNLLNRNTRKHTGLANERTIHIGAQKRGRITLTVQKTKEGSAPATQPAAHFVKTSLKGNSTRQLARKVVNATVRSGYRADLKSAALGRLSALVRSQAKKE
ncbi:ribosomal protein L28e [Ramicandelaber brevisporus]|nr:ribosomal protein L28e [Ramicandelaber brevisporus]